MKTNDNTVLLTGGTGGFGAEFIKQLTDLGNTVIITGRNQSKLDTIKKQFPAVHTFQSDVSDVAAIKELYDKLINQFPKLNVLINNAGEMRKINLHDVSVDLNDITREININLSGPIRIVQKFLPHLKKQKNAAIVNVSSGLAFVPFPATPIYGASKAGLHSYTVSLRMQLQETNVKVFELVAPAANTPLNDQFLNDPGFNAKLLAEPGKIIKETLNAMKKDKYEVAPGFGKVLRLMSRLAPGFIVKQMSKTGKSTYLNQ